MNTAIAPKRNGNQEQTLPEHRQKTVEAGLATYQKVLAERDELEGKLRDAMLRIEAQVVQLDALKGVVNMMESTYLSTKMENRVAQYQAQRDDAVKQAAAFEATLTNIFAMLSDIVPGMVER
jgi:ABC-type phosphate transport system auxiliary subunit